MQSKTSFFSKKIFWKNMTRFWPVWASYFVILAFIFPISLITELRWTEFNAFTALKTSYDLLKNTYQFGMAMGLVYGVLSAMAVYSYLYTARSAGAMACLPIRRQGMFITSYSSGLFGLLASNVVVFLLLLLVEAINGVLDIVVLLQWLAMISAQIFFFYSFASLCAVLTGHILVLPAVYAVLNFTAVVVEALVKELLESFVYGMNLSGEYILQIFSPPVDLWSKRVFLDNIITGEERNSIYYYLNTKAGAAAAPGDLVIRYNGWGALIAYAAAAVVIAVIAYFIYRKRRMETASDVVAVRGLKPVFKYCLTFGCSIVIGSGLYSIVFSGMDSVNPAIVTAACILFGGAIGYFAAEMLMQKSFRVFRAWKGFAVFCAVIVLTVAACETDLFGYERYVPDYSQIESVEIMSRGENASLNWEENIKDVMALHENIISNKKEYETETIDEQCYLTIAYQLKNGKLVDREYYIPASEELYEDKTSDLGALSELMNSTEAVKERKETDIEVNADTVYDANIQWWDGKEYKSIQLTPEEATELYYSCIVPDTDSGALGRVWIYSGEDYYNTVYDATIYIDLVEKSAESYDGYINDNFYTRPTVDSKITNTALEAMGIELHTEGESSAYNEKYDSSYAAAVYAG